MPMILRRHEETTRKHYLFLIYRGHSHLPAIMTSNDDFVITSLRGLLIVLGLSVHELFEGLAIGLESSANHVW